MVRVDSSLDYAGHELEAKRLMKEAHKLLLRNEVVEAVKSLDLALVELRLMRTAVISHIKE